MNHSLFEKLFIKRFCLPANTDVAKYENGDASIKNCICGNYYHVACVVKEDNFDNILSIGINILGNDCEFTSGVHAEYDALRKLPHLKQKKKMTGISLLVLRLSKTNKIQSSKPCYKCVKMLNKIPTKIGYSLRNIYYSDGNGNIVKTSLSVLQKEEQHHTRLYTNVRRRRFMLMNSM
jgi:cytidine deaminase